MPLIYLIAGEVSGDALGARLMRALVSARPDLRFGGIGGDAMAERGLASLFPMRELALMGFLEVLPQLRKIRCRLDQTVADITARRPDVVVTIDAPGFALRVLRRIAPLGIPRAHYVAPQVWAWREGRVRKYPGLWDRLLCLLPFEPEFFARHSLPATFVGHPVLEGGANLGDAMRFRRRHGLSPEARTLVLMPGSRHGEVARLLPVFHATLQRLVAAASDLHPVIPIAGPVADAVRAGSAQWSRPPILIDDAVDKHDAFAAAAAALTKSGTSTLELALAGVPMLVTYRLNPLSAAIARRLVSVQHASLVNLLAGKDVVPELLQQDCTPDSLAAALGALLQDPRKQQDQRAAFRRVVDMLRPPHGTPSEAAATVVLELLDRPPRAP